MSMCVHTCIHTYQIIYIPTCLPTYLHACMHTYTRRQSTYALPVHRAASPSLSLYLSLSLSCLHAAKSRSSLLLSLSLSIILCTYMWNFLHLSTRHIHTAHLRDYVKNSFCVHEAALTSMSAYMPTADSGVSPMLKPND